MAEEKKEMLPFEIPPEGTLGLLALGSVALKPWRQKRIDSGYEAQLIERVKESKIHAEERKKKRKEMIEKAKEAQKKKQEDEQKNS